MFHGFDNTYLYTAYRLTSTFVDNLGNVESGTGTGFFVKPKDGDVVLVTNRHVVDIEFFDAKYAGFKLRQLRVSGKDIDPSSGQPDITDECTVHDGTLKYSTIPENDIACLVNLSVCSAADSNLTIRYLIPQELLATATDFQSKFSVCDFVAFPGFPEWYDKRQHRPILRTGTISSDPRYDYAWEQDYKGECIAYEAFSYGGSSGSPVFAVQKGPRPGKGITFPGFRELKLIGINAGHLKTEERTHSGISYMYKASAILDTIESEKGLPWQMQCPSCL